MCCQRDEDTRTLSLHARVFTTCVTAANKCLSRCDGRDPERQHRTTCYVSAKCPPMVGSVFSRDVSPCASARHAKELRPWLDSADLVGRLQKFKLSSTTNNKYAFVSLTAGAAFVDAVRTLGCSLRAAAQGHGVDMLSLCYKMTRAQIGRVEASGWTCISPPQVQTPTGQWGWDFTMKVVPFTFTQYEKIILLDSDMVAVNAAGLAPLLRMTVEQGYIMAVPDTASHFLWPTDPEVQDQIQGGFIVLEPSMEVFRDLLKHLPFVRSIDGGGQGFMSAYFKGRIAWLPAKYNYVRSSFPIGLINRTSGYYRLDVGSILASQDLARGAADQLVRRDLAAGDVVLAHFHSRPKPWECDPRRKGSCGRRWLGGDTRITALYEAWLDARQECKK